MIVGGYYKIVTDYEPIGENMSVDLSNAKTIAWYGEFTGKWYVASRENRNSDFKWQDGEVAYPEKYAEREGYLPRLTVIEEFPAPTLEELVGDAPAFEAEDAGTHLVRLWVKRWNGRWAAVNVRNRGFSLADPSIPTAKEDYSLSNMSFIDLDTVVRYYPDPRP